MFWRAKRDGTMYLTKSAPRFSATRNVAENAKISRWNIRRTVFQYFKKLIASTENSNSPIAVPVGLIFLLCVFFFHFILNLCDYVKFAESCELKLGWSEAEPHSRCCMMCLGDGFSLSIIV